MKNMVNTWSYVIPRYVWPDIKYAFSQCDFAVSIREFLHFNLKKLNLSPWIARARHDDWTDPQNVHPIQGHEHFAKTYYKLKLVDLPDFESIYVGPGGH